MKIISYKKVKSNLYEISLDDKTKYKLYDEIILKSGLLLRKEIDLKSLNKLIDENNYYELYNLVLKYISNKMHTEKEIYNKFKDYSKKDLNKIITKLKEAKYIDNDSYIKAYINDAINLKMIGQDKIKNDLIKLGLEEKNILSYLNNIKKEVWEEKIKKLVDTMIKNNRKYSLIMLKNKIVSNLINKGFVKEEILKYIDEIDIKIDSSIYEKEYNKLKVKLSRKYQGEQLEWEIKRRLKAKGF